MGHPRELNLRYLYEAAKLGSMRAAGDYLGVAVSSVSRQIAQLEAEMGIELIEHGRRTIALTEAGKLLIGHYSRQLRLQETLDAQLADIKGLRTGRIDLAVGEGFVGEPFSRVLIEFNARHPGVVINVHMSASSNEVARLVAEDEAHLGLVFQVSDEPRIRVLASVQQTLCVTMRVDHPLARSPVLRLADLTAYRLCLPEPSFRTRELLRAVESREGVALQPGILCNSITLLKRLLESGDFFTLLPRLAVSQEVQSGRFAAVRIESSALQSACVQLISRVGRRLPPAPARMLGALTAYLRACGGSGDAPMTAAGTAQADPPEPAVRNAPAAPAEKSPASADGLRATGKSRLGGEP